MLTFSFPYAHGVQSASFDEKNLAEVLEPNQRLFSISAQAGF